MKGTKMKTAFDPGKNFKNTKNRVEYIPRKEADPQTYLRLGYKCGLEVHQQLKTGKKLFCRCPAGIYQSHDDFNAEVVRHMRPTLSEFGEYDGTALMEFKTRKNIIYRLKNITTCTYETDDTPPFKINKEALRYAMEIALLLKTNIVGELHITRKQYLDGSIPTGFQRTGIIGIEGEIVLKNKKVRIIQLSLEEDSCREVSDIGHDRIYTTDRLGMPLIEVVTYPDMKSPDEAEEAGQYIRFLCRSSDKVRTGIGAARQDVNVSVTGGTRIEIKGVSHISWIPELTHNEAFRQKALLKIKDELAGKKLVKEKWKIRSKEIPFGENNITNTLFGKKYDKNNTMIAVNLPGFQGILSFFTQPGKIFADEISDRLKVIACLEKPNMVHSEQLQTPLDDDTLNYLRKTLKAEDSDGQIIIHGPKEDIKTALETIEERCLLAFDGVPNETRKSLADGTTIFERVLPGPDRMYPDTDSAPIPITEEFINGCNKNQPREVQACLKQLRQWGVPEDTHHFILKKNLFKLLHRIVNDLQLSPKFVGIIIGHYLKYMQRRFSSASGLKVDTIFQLFAFVTKKKLEKDIIKVMLPIMCEHPEMDFQTVLTTIGFKKKSHKQIITDIPELKKKFKKIVTSKKPVAEINWIMGVMRETALGNISLRELRLSIEKGEYHE